MLIDWFTVIAQVVNFLILVWLLKRYLYNPILNALDAREKKIAREMADADLKKTEAEKERDEFRRKNEEFDQQRAALMHRATQEVQDERQRLLDEARDAADVISARRRDALISDAHNLNQALGKRAQQEVFAIARKALTDLASTSLEERMAEVFAQRLRELDEKTRETVGTALRASSEPALVRSAFEMPVERCTAIQNVISTTFSLEVMLHFETAPDLICGIELSAGGQKLAWSISDYLSSLEIGVNELLNEKVRPKDPARSVEPKPELKDA